ncbi:MAG: response regulator [Candidatus Rokubacteria bacterium]|nr:response regulator [Candidatus Rokubacteria bacterium]
MSTSGPAAHRPAILVVDDDENVRDSYGYIFESWADVTPADGAASAVTLAHQRSFDVILLDVRMPRVSGVEAFTPLRDAQPRTPIVFVTAVDNAETAVRAMRLGAFDYVVKPFELERLVGVVRRAIAAAGGVVNVVGREVGACATAAVLASARAGVPTAVGQTADGRRTVEADGRLLAEVYTDIAPGAPPVPEFIARVATYVGGHYRGVKVESLAAAVGMSPDRLARVFRDETTLTTKEYVTRVQIEVARYLLRETRDTVEVIADRVGLCDAPHLTRVFRRHTGDTPGGYRGTVGMPPAPPAGPTQR